MKKIMFLFAMLIIVFSVSACTSKKSVVSEEQVAPISETADEDINLVDDKASSAPVESSVISPVASEIVPATVTPEVLVETNKIMSPDKQENLSKTYSQAILKTSEGDITVKFYPEAPLTVNNFLNLAQKGFYNGTKFHRVIKGFMIQGGDPLTKNSDASVYGTGGPGYEFKNEDSGHKLVVGNIAMANAGMNTNGSQFFIVTAVSTPDLDGGYTNFGEVVSGMDVVRKIENSQVTQSSSGEMSIPVDYVTVKSVKIIK